MKVTESETIHDDNLKDVNHIKLLMAWWDFMDLDKTSYRKEYSQSEQFEVVHKFLTSVPFELVKYKETER